MKSQDKTLDEILNGVYLFGMNGGLGYEKFENELPPYEAKKQILSLKKRWQDEVQVDLESIINSIKAFDSDTIPGINKGNPVICKNAVLKLLTNQLKREDK